jgi:hypothetical protein
MVDAFYRAGSLVFGGGHEMLPLLQAEVVPTGWVSNDAFLAGYGAGHPRPSIHLCGVSWCINESCSLQLVEWPDLPAGDLYAILSAGRWCVVMLR